MTEKRLLVPQRLRRPPVTGWSWVDRRFLREHGDQLRLRLTQQVLEQARQELLDRDLIAHQLPLVQVLSLATPGVSRRPEPGQGLLVLGDILRQVGVAPAASAHNQNVADKNVTSKPGRSTP